MGHNGAGKTTLINILTGIFEPTSGNALIYGNDITKHMSNVRESLGVCQQFDILYDELTLMDHLHYALGLKNIPHFHPNSNLQECITAVGLDLSDMNK